MLTYFSNSMLEAQGSRGSVILASASGKLGPSGAWQVYDGCTRWSASSRRGDAFVLCITVAAQNVGKSNSAFRGQAAFQGIGFKGIQRDGIERKEKQLVQYVVSIHGFRDGSGQRTSSKKNHHRVGSERITIEEFERDPHSLNVDQAPFTKMLWIRSSQLQDPKTLL